MSDDRDREIAELKAEVERLTRALDTEAAQRGRADRPLFGHGVRGGYFGAAEFVIVAIALAILFTVFHHLTTPDPWRPNPDIARPYYFDSDVLRPS